MSLSQRVEEDGFQLKVITKKDGEEMGKLNYIIESLLGSGSGAVKSEVYKGRVKFSYLGEEQDERETLSTPEGRRACGIWWGAGGAVDCPALPQFVAIKMILPAHKEDKKHEGWRRWLVQEEKKQHFYTLQKWAEIKEDDEPRRILNFFDAFSLENPFREFFVLEYCSKGDVYTCYGGKKMSQTEIKILYRECVEAINVCHNMGICHRDIKPENFLVDDKGSIKLADFGFATLFKEPDGEMIELRSHRGTPLFVSPEVAALKSENFYPSDQNPTKNWYRGDKADIWSLGIFLYEISNGIGYALDDKGRRGASGACSRPLPKDWETAMSRRTGRMYYVNYKTSQSTYDRDDPMIPDNVPASGVKRNPIHISEDILKDPCTTLDWPTEDKDKYKKLLQLLLDLNPEKRPTTSDILDYEELWSSRASEEQFVMTPAAAREARLEYILDSIYGNARDAMDARNASDRAEWAGLGEEEFAFLAGIEGWEPEPEPQIALPKTKSIGSTQGGGGGCHYLRRSFDCISKQEIINESKAWERFIKADPNKKSKRKKSKRRKSKKRQSKRRKSRKRKTRKRKSRGSRKR